MAVKKILAGKFLLGWSALATRLRTIALPLVKIDVDLDRKMGIFCCRGKIGGLVDRGVSCRLRSSRSLKREECLALGNGSAASRAVWYRPVVKQVSDHTF